MLTSHEIHQRTKRSKCSTIDLIIIDHETKTAKLLKTPHELSASILLTQNERTYQGIENRLNFLTNKNLTLQKQIQSIKKGEFYADAQRNLSIMIEP